MHWNCKHRTGCFYRSQQDNLGRTPLSSTPREFITLWCIMAMHQLTTVNDPTSCRHQKHISQTHITINWYHHPHGQEAEVYSRSCNSRWKENEPSRLFAVHLCTTSSVCEITLFLKTLRSIMMTCAKINYTLHFWLCHILLYVTSASLQLFPWWSVTLVFKLFIIPSMHLLHIAFLKLENPPWDTWQGL